MLIPVRCFTCGKIIGNKYEQYLALCQQDKPAPEIFSQLGIRRWCCKRMLISHVDVCDKMLIFGDIQAKTLQATGVTFVKRTAKRAKNFCVAR
jgi:DNA-directed RNA polymerase I, II, and III subunit RPABC5